MKVTIGISNRHVHLTKEHIEILFGANHELEVLKTINQPGQYASVEKVTIETVKGRIDGVRVLGPVRSYTQVEISLTDAFTLGIKPPLRESGEIEGSAGLTIVGPKGQIELTEGCIIATRHIHMTPTEASANGLHDKDKVSVKVDGPKGGLMSHVTVRVDPASYFEMHIDTDDANAHMLKNGDEVSIMKDF